MKRRSLFSLVAPALALMLASGNVLAIDYSKFTADALLMMRESVAEADRANYRQAFVDALSRMSPADRKAFQTKALTRMMQMAPAERQAMIADLSRHMQAMDPAQLEALKNKFVGQSSRAVNSSVMPPRLPSNMARSATQMMPNRSGMSMPPIPSYQPQYQGAPPSTYPVPGYAQYPAAPQGYGYGGYSAPYGYGNQAYRPYPAPGYGSYGYR